MFVENMQHSLHPLPVSTLLIHGSHFLSFYQSDELLYLQQSMEYDDVALKWLVWGQFSSQLNVKRGEETEP